VENSSCQPSEGISLFCWEQMQTIAMKKKSQTPLVMFRPRMQELLSKNIVIEISTKSKMKI
jgi:hypothetical protein